jgi:hypothetical protein
MRNGKSIYTAFVLKWDEKYVAGFHNGEHSLKVSNNKEIVISLIRGGLFQKP